VLLMKWQQILKMLAPYLAVVIFWTGLSNGWLAILAYHAQIILWATISPRINGRKAIIGTLNRRAILLALPTVCAGPLLYYLLPHVTNIELTIWLAEHQLSSFALLCMIPYFGIIHPFLEQLHWFSLRQETAISHVMFAGYHMLVLSSLFSLPWLILSFVLLSIVSLLWTYITMQTKGIMLAYISHALADAGLIIAVSLQY